jgi:phosphoadenosine phosphosulfate reductase
MNNMYVQGFYLNKGTLKKQTVCKISTTNGKLKVKYNRNTDDKCKFLTHDELAQYHEQHLQEIEKESLDVIKEFVDKYSQHQIRICSSEGKDSTITKHLVRRVDPSSKVLFSNTTLDTAETYLSIKRDPNHEIINPTHGFYQWRKESNFIPTRFGRACCRIFKEGAMNDKLNQNDKYLFFYGMRNDESKTRADYQYEWKNEKWVTDNWVGVLPIRKWSDLDVWLYILWKKLDFNKLYTYGYGRVGCIVACPFRTDYENIIDREFLSGYHKRWQEILRQDFLDNQKWPVLNCTLDEYLNGAWKAGMVREEPTDEVVKEFADHKGIEVDVARRYFNQQCNCGKKVNKNEAALSMKYLGRNTKQIMCMSCLSKCLDRDKTQLRQDIKEFKKQGCSLF